MATLDDYFEGIGKGSYGDEDYFLNEEKGRKDFVEREYEFLKEKVRKNYWRTQLDNLKKDSFSSGQREDLEETIGVPLKGAQPDILEKHILARLKQSNKKLRNYVTENFDEALQGMELPHLIDYALIFDKDYSKVVKNANDKNAMANQIFGQILGNDKELVNAFLYHATVDPAIVERTYQTVIDIQRFKSINKISKTKDKSEIIGHIKSQMDDLTNEVQEGNVDEGVLKKHYSTIADAYTPVK